MASKQFYAHGKLLLTGEYTVLDGAIALAIPTKFGQWLSVSSTPESNNLQWNSVDRNGDSWFAVTFDSKLNLLNSTDSKIGSKLQKILHTAVIENPNFVQEFIGKSVETKLEFNRDWGLGSSSTLIHLISQWAKVNPYHLLKNSFGGSGYDIACAEAEGSIFFNIGNPPNIQKINFNPQWKENLYFVYLGQKQVSSQEIAKYSDLQFDRDKLATKISELSNQLITTNSLHDFKSILEEHEQLLSHTLGYPTVKSQRFSNIQGTFKSLGAWGGDFVLFVGDKTELEEIKSLGYTTILSWEEMILKA